MKNITDKQKETLKYLIDYQKENGFYPSLKEMADFFGINLKAMSDRISALIKKEYIERVGDRAYRILKVD